MDKKFLIQAYERMTRIRKFDEWIHLHFRDEDSPLMGLMHSQAGEEGYAAAVICQLRKSDYLSTTYRNHAHSIARGIDLKALAAEICGREAGCCKARAGNMHAVDQNLNIIAGFGIIGAGIPATVGTAFATKYRGGDEISAAFFGDGACAQGAFHESMNLAAALSLPVLFINNNNHYAMSTPAGYALAADSTTNYAAAHGMPWEKADGMDFFAAAEAARKGIAHVRGGKGPYYIEYDCFRYDGQWEGDPQDYKLADEVAAYRGRDPLVQFRRAAAGKSLLTERELDGIEAAAAREVEEAFAYAASCPMPPLSDIMTDIYADPY